MRLDDCQVVILDAADILLKDFEFEIRAIMECVPKTRQSALFSASTLPKSVLAMIAKRFCMRDADVYHIQVGSGYPLAGIKDIDQEVHLLSNDGEKNRHLRNVVLNNGSIDDRYREDFL